MCSSRFVNSTTSSRDTLLTTFIVTLFVVKSRRVQYKDYAMENTYVQYHAAMKECLHIERFRYNRKMTREWYLEVVFRRQGWIRLGVLQSASVSVTMVRIYSILWDNLKLSIVWAGPMTLGSTKHLFMSSTALSFKL